MDIQKHAGLPKLGVDVGDAKRHMLRVPLPSISSFVWVSAGFVALRFRLIQSLESLKLVKYHKYLFNPTVKCFRRLLLLIKHFQVIPSVVVQVGHYDASELDWQ